MKKYLGQKTFLAAGLLTGCMVLAAAAFAAAAFYLRSPERAQIHLPGWMASALPGPTGSTAASPEPTRPAAVVEALPALVLSNRETQEISLSPRYRIEAVWPNLEWDDPRAGGFNRAVDAFIENEIRIFKEGAAAIPDDSQPEELSSYIEISYQPTHTLDGLLSILMHVSFYSAGAAHPNYYSYAINYDLRAGRELALADLFRPGSGWLEKISGDCIRDLRNRDVLAWEEGALPRDENYRVWNITPAGLLITFDPYQVAPYAAGPQAVTIPYQDLGELLRAGGPLSAYSTRELKDQP